MRFPRVAVLPVVAFLVVPAVRADVTIHYKNDLKLGRGAPPPVAQAVSNQMKSFLSDAKVIQIKQTKGYSTMGPFASLVDFAKQQITLIDPAHKQFTTVYLKDYADEVLAAMQAADTPSMPPEAQKILDAMKTSFSSRKTGRTDTILGVQVEETELTLAIEMPPPGGASPTAGATQASAPIPMMRMVIQLWTATAPEIQRIPALQEFVSAHMESSAESLIMIPGGSMQKLLSSLPGGRGFTEVLEELSKSKSVTLKTHAEFYTPALAQAFQAMQNQGEDLPKGFDPNAPIMEMSMEATDISTAPIDDAVFQVPRDYHVVLVPEFLKSISAAPKASESPMPAEPPQ